MRTCCSPTILSVVYFYSTSAHSFRLVSYNLRYDVKHDNITVKDSLAKLPDPTLKPSYLSLAGQEQPWSSRRIRIAQDILNEGVVLAGARGSLFICHEVE